MNFTIKFIAQWFFLVKLIQSFNLDTSLQISFVNSEHKPGQISDWKCTNHASTHVAAILELLFFFVVLHLFGEVSKT